MSEQNEPQASPQPEAEATTTTSTDQSLVGAAPAEDATAEPEGETATPEAEAPAPLAAEDITLPEGMEADEELLGSLVETLNADSTPQERAAGLLELHKSVLEKAGTQMEETWKATQDEWRNAVKAMPEIGGDNLDRTLGDIAKVVDRYGGKDAREAFDLTGAGNHPAVVAMFAKIAKDLNETPPVSGAPPSGAPKTRAERMFGGNA